MLARFSLEEVSGGERAALAAQGCSVPVSELAGASSYAPQPALAQAPAVARPTRWAALVVNSQCTQHSNLRIQARPRSPRNRFCCTSRSARSAQREQRDLATAQNRAGLGPPRGQLWALFA